VEIATPSSFETISAFFVVGVFLGCVHTIAEVELYKIAFCAYNINLGSSM